jgi:DNA-binding SARP family transcriptional activator/tetratricopeptide (TPR) repeat protein
MRSWLEGWLEHKILRWGLVCQSLLNERSMNLQFDLSGKQFSAVTGLQLALEWVMASVPQSLSIPAAPAWALKRRRLLEGLEHAEGSLVVLCAGLGWGKTLLASHWAAAHGALWLDLRRSGLALLEGRHEPLVLEGYTPGNPALDSQIETLLEGRASGSCLLLSRRRPSLPLGLMRSAGQVTLLEANDLAFTNAEVLELCSLMNLSSPDDEQLEALVRQTAGWSFAVRLSLQQRVLGSGLEGVRGRLSPYSDVLSEIWDALEPEQQDFVLETAILEELQPTVCDALRQASDSAQRLEGLFQRGVPLSRPRPGTAFAYFEPFRDFVRAVLEQRSDLALLEARAARVLLEHDQAFQAAGHAVRADDWDLVISALTTSYEQAYVSGKGLQLRSYLNALPERYRDQSEVLQLEAHLDWAAGDHEVARVKAERAAQSQNPNTKAAALSLIAAVHYSKGALSEEIKTLELALGSKTDHRLLRAKLFHLLGGAYLRAGKLNDAKTRLLEAQVLFRPNELGHASVLTQLPYLDLARGQPRAAMEGFGRAIRAHRELGNRRGEALSLYSRAIAQNQAGMHQHALFDLEEAKRLHLSLGQSFHAALVERETADAWRDLGDARALEQYHKAIAELERLAGGAGLLHAHHGLAVYYRRNHDPQAASRAARRALDHALGGDTAFVGLVKCHLALLEHDAESMRSSLEVVLGQPQVYFQALALLYASALNSDMALELRAKEVIQDGGFNHLLHEEKGLLQASSTRISTAYTNSNLGATPEPRFKLLTLGRLEVLDARGQRITLSPTEGRLLAFLSLRRGASLHTDTIIDALWTNLDYGIDKRHSLQTLVYNLRHKLERTVIESRDRGYYSFDPRQSIWVDAEAFREHLSAGRFHLAIELYGGDLLPGVEWADEQRREFENRYLSALERQAEHEAAVDHLEPAASLLEMVLRLQPQAEQTMRRLSGFYKQLGRYDQAMRLERGFEERISGLSEW